MATIIRHRKGIVNGIVWYVCALAAFMCVMNLGAAQISWDDARAAVREGDESLEGKSIADGEWSLTIDTMDARDKAIWAQLRKQYDAEMRTKNGRIKWCGGIAKQFASDDGKTFTTVYSNGFVHVATNRVARPAGMEERMSKERRRIRAEKMREEARKRRIEADKKRFRELAEKYPELKSEVVPANK